MGNGDWGAQTEANLSSVLFYSHYLDLHLNQHSPPLAMHS